MLLATLGRLRATAREVIAGIADLVLPADCAGCGVPSTRAGICADCATILGGLPVPARPSPPPSGLPPCFTVGEYNDALREVILAYKERGQRNLAGPLGDALAHGVLTAFPVRRGPVALVPVPSTAAAIRARHGDHMMRLARRAALTMAGRGCPAIVAQPLRALPKQDSAHLDRDERARTARHAFALRPGHAEPLRSVADNSVVVLLDDILTTGSTLAAVATQLLSVGVPVAFCVTLAATRLRKGDKLYGTQRDLGRD